MREVAQANNSIAYFSWLSDILMSEDARPLAAAYLQRWAASRL
ncbi:MAG TPA: hypothetical protein VF666_05870 [Pyrinomonadaceae bacterium]